MQQRDDTTRTSAGWRRSSPTTTGDQWLPSVDGPVVFASGSPYDTEPGSGASGHRSVTRTTTRGASCCTAQPTRPRELPAVEVNPAQIPSLIGRDHVWACLR